MICSLIVLKCYSNVTKLVQCAVKIIMCLPRLVKFSLLLSLNGRFLFVSIIICFWRSSKYMIKHLKGNLERLTKIKMMIKWGGFLSPFFFFHNSRYESLYYLTWFIYKDNIIIWNIYTLLVYVAQLYAFTR